MLFRVRDLQIPEEQIDVGDQRRDLFPGDMEGAFHGGVDPRFVAFFCQPRQKFRMQQAFTAGEGDTAAGGIIVVPVLFDPGKHLIHGLFLAAKLQRPGWAAFSAAAAAGAALPKVHHLSVPDHMMLRADLQASATMDAFLGQIQDLGLHSLGLGVMAPPAAEGTSLEVDHGAHTGAVMQGAAGDIGDGGGHRHACFVLPMM